ncbi:MAG: hypothetical protein QOG20_6292 [Pseudonocardiales bacterium]|uniref:hypothetical protein n=1 Tax=Pseudonocardia sp. TaxID=60912 RepID=UPI0026021CE1|nr:hypothetical protein [Pseudonocardia sp.]MCW2716824.1 rane protein [Pseudonocardia sp.]MDT7614535.1 hypothetical protein [Pseudonocardiales bacterium]MDT7710685.1 hypothetical protein [Pseudonocardiales bacterium]
MPRWTPSHLPVRLTAGAFILNAGLGKWSGDEQTAAGLHGMAAGTYPFLKSIDPPRFLKLLAGAEIGLGAALLAPFVPAGVAGVGLTGFAAGLLGLYVRTPGMRQGIRPTQQGTAIAKDVWLLGMGAGLVLDALSARRSS